MADDGMTTTQIVEQYVRRLKATGEMHKKAKIQNIAVRQEGRTVYIKATMTIGPPVDVEATLPLHS